MFLFARRLLCVAVCGVALVLSGAGSARLAMAGSGTYEPTRAPQISVLPQGAHAYFIEFRGRSEADGWGHAYVVLGAFDGAGRRTDVVRFGFVPKDADDELWSQFLVPVRGMVGVSQSDVAVVPDVLFRARISRADYDRVLGDLDAYRTDWTTYLLIGHNCNDLAAAVARSIGLDAPLITFQAPTSYIAELKFLNDPAMVAARKAE